MRERLRRRRERREEIIKTSTVMEREAMAGWWRELVLQLLELRLEPGLGQRGLTEDQSLITRGGRLVEDLRKMFCSWKS